MNKYDIYLILEYQCITNMTEKCLNETIIAACEIYDKIDLQ